MYIIQPRYRKEITVASHDSRFLFNGASRYRVGYQHSGPIARRAPGNSTGIEACEDRENRLISIVEDGLCCCQLFMEGIRSSRIRDVAPTEGLLSPSGTYSGKQMPPTRNCGVDVPGTLVLRAETLPLSRGLIFISMSPKLRAGIPYFEPSTSQLYVVQRLACQGYILSLISVSPSYSI